MRWFFQEHDGYGDIDQSSSSEAFISGSIRDITTALVREGIQNALDARDATLGLPVRVRITLGTCDRAKANPWINDLADHLSLADVGAPDAPRLNEECRYLVFEDFNTIGLVGDFRAPYRPNEENNFVNFMYHDGVTGKKDNKLGSRGVGKVVFAMASRIRTVFALTIPSNTKRKLLVGKNLLKFRQLGEKLFGSRAYFLSNWPSKSAREPVTNIGTINEFQTSFNVSRVNENGLSLVVPYVDSSITTEKLRAAITQEYFYAVLADELVVELVGENIEVIDSQSLPNLGSLVTDEIAELARWAILNPAQIEILPPSPDCQQSLTDDLVTEHARTIFRQAVDDEKPLGVKAHLYIHPKNEAAQLSYFYIYFKPSSLVSAKTVFIRELLPVSDVREAKPVSKMLSLVLIPSGILADFLRAAEGANHTDWSPRTDRFQERYKGRLGEIRFVVTAANRIAEIVLGKANKPIGGIATQFFSTNYGNKDKIGRGKSKNDKGKFSFVQQHEIEGTNLKPYLVEQTDGGFVIRQNPIRKIIEQLPTRLRVRVAYDVVNGSPWSRYEPADFDFRSSTGTTRLRSDNAECEIANGNRFSIISIEQGFIVHGDGFDPNRDLIVDVVETTLKSSVPEEAIE